MLRPTPGDPRVAVQHHLNTGAKENQKLNQELFILFTARAFRKLLSIYVSSYFHSGFEGRMGDLIVSVPDQCLSFYLTFKMEIPQEMEERQ